MTCHAADEPVLRAAFLGEFPECEITAFDEHPADILPESAWATIKFLDFIAPPPYSHLFTRSSELRLSPLAPFLNTLGSLRTGRIGLYQVVLQPVSPNHNWHRNIECLIDLEYTFKAYGGGGSQQYQRYAQSAPSGQLQSMASDVETKSHSDKPFFATAVRVAEINASGESSPSALEALATFMGLFQHGGRPLQSLSQADYRASLSPIEIQSIFSLGLTYHAGCILNSLECASILHMPPLSSLTERKIKCPVLVSLPPSEEVFEQGTHIGYCTHAGKKRAVYIPFGLRSSHTHLIGRSRRGKSTVMEYMCCQDVAKGDGIAVIDPHGDLAKNLLGRMKDEWLDRIVYFDPGDPEYVPQWNALACMDGQPPDRVMDDLLWSLKRNADGWGHRLETLFRHGFYGLAHVPGGTLSDIATLFSMDKKKRDALREQILSVVQNQKARQFWQHEYPKYKDAEFMPLQHKLSALLLNDTVGLMFSLPTNRLNFREMLDTGKIFIADLSTVGSDTREFLGNLIISLFHLAALSRSNMPLNKRKPFHLYVDEAHHFEGTMEGMIAETGKYNVGLVLAHQYFGQWETRRSVDALGATGTTIAFKVAADDDRRMANFIGGDVTPDDLTTLQRYHAIARIDTEVVRIETPYFGTPPDEAMAEKAKRLSRERYCLPQEQAYARIRDKGTKTATHIVSRVAQVSDIAKIKEYCYDEF